MTRILAVFLVLLSSLTHSQVKPNAAATPPEKTADPIALACPTYKSEDGADSFNAWMHAQQLEHIEGDGFLGTNLGHTLEALSFYCKASAAGSADAAFAIGHIFDEGYTVNTLEGNGRAVTQHVPPDKKAAFSWYRLAADRKSTPALIRLAQYYFDLDHVGADSGVPRDVDKGMDLARQAADLGNTDAQLFMSFAYAPGLFPESPVKKDRPIAFNWYTKAAARLTEATSECNNPLILKSMTAQVPDMMDGRPLTAVSAITARGPNEVVCVMFFGPAPAAEGEGLLGVLRRQVAGAVVDRWCFTVTENAKTRDDFVLPETRAEAMTGAMLRMAPIVNALAASFGPPPNK